MAKTQSKQYYENTVILCGKVAKVLPSKSGKVAHVTVAYDEDGHKMSVTAFDDQVVKTISEVLEEGDSVTVKGNVCYTKESKTSDKYVGVVRATSIEVH